VPYFEQLCQYHVFIIQRRPARPALRGRDEAPIMITKTEITAATLAAAFALLAGPASAWKYVPKGTCETMKTPNGMGSLKPSTS
jgi:uncharacterized membrane protein